MPAPVLGTVAKSASELADSIARRSTNTDTLLAAHNASHSILIDHRFDAKAWLPVAILACSRTQFRLRPGSNFNVFKCPAAGIRGDFNAESSLGSER